MQLACFTGIDIKGADLTRDTGKIITSCNRPTMPFFNGFTALALASLGTSVSTVLSAPSGDWKGHGGWRGHKDPFSNASWPLPRKVYGENDTANVDAATEGWGGIQ